jgi:tetratricopeptide (TPR) repeat protein
VYLSRHTLEQADTEFRTRIRQRWSTALEGRLNLAQAYRLARRSEEAKAVAVEMLRLAREQGLRGLEAYAVRLLAEVAADAEPPETEAAEAHYADAFALATELGMRPLVAHCHLGLGELYRRTVDRTKAAVHLTTAATMYREMGMALWLEKAEAAQQHLGGCPAS